MVQMKTQSVARCQGILQQTAHLSSLPEELGLKRQCHLKKGTSIMKYFERVNVFITDELCEITDTKK